MENLNGDVKSSLIYKSQIAFGAMAMGSFLASALAIFVIPELRNRSDLLSMVVTTLINGFMMVLGYFYGTSAGSSRKTEMLGHIGNQPQSVKIEKHVNAETVVDGAENIDEVNSNGKR